MPGSQTRLNYAKDLYDKAFIRNNSAAMGHAHRMAELSRLDSTQNDAIEFLQDLIRKVDLNIDAAKKRPKVSKEELAGLNKKRTIYVYSRDVLLNS